MKEQPLSLMTMDLKDVPVHEIPYFYGLIEADK